jgi:tRNA(fMet)-specific endonuclease VapC
LILDTNAVSAFADGASELAAVLAETDELCLPVIVLGEFRFGIARSRHRLRYETWLQSLVGATRVLVVDEQTAGHYAAIREQLRTRGRPIPSNDTWIAALANQYGLPVVSRDEHFDEVAGLRRIGW